MGRESLYANFAAINGINELYRINFRCALSN